jgi:hypothetical protein
VHIPEASPAIYKSVSRHRYKPIALVVVQPLSAAGSQNRLPLVGPGKNGWK